MENKPGFVERYKKIISALCTSIIDDNFKGKTSLDWSPNMQSFLDTTAEKINKEILTELEKIIQDYLCFVTITIREEARWGASSNGFMYEGEGIILNGHSVKGFRILYQIIGRFPLKTDKK